MTSPFLSADSLHAAPPPGDAHRPTNAALESALAAACAQRDEAEARLRELRACAVECERARLAGDMLSAQLQASTLVQMLVADAREQHRAELPQTPVEMDLGLLATCRTCDGTGRVALDDTGDTVACSDCRGGE